MSFTWLITGISREKPRLGYLREYNGEDLYHPNQPDHGQIDEMLMQFTGKPVLVVAIDPSGYNSVEGVAQEMKNAVIWAFERRSKDDPVLRLISEQSRTIIEVDADCNIAYSDGRSETCQHRPAQTFVECGPGYGPGGHCPKFDYYHRENPPSVGGGKGGGPGDCKSIPPTYPPEKVMKDIRFENFLTALRTRYYDNQISTEEEFKRNALECIEETKEGDAEDMQKHRFSLRDLK